VFALACFGSTDETLAAVQELAAAAETSGDLEQTVQAMIYRAACLLEAGDVVAAQAELATCERLEERLGQPVQRWLRHFCHADIAFFRGELAEAERLTEEARRIGLALGRQESGAIHLLNLYLIRREQGRLADLAVTVGEARVQMPAFAVARCLPGHLAAELGRQDEARAFLDRHVESGFAEILESSTHRMTIGLLIETAARVGHAAAAAALAPLLGALGQRHLCVPATAVLGPTLRFHGLIAATTGAWGEAARLLREAAAESRAAGAAGFTLRCELELAQAILVGGAGDPAQGRALLADVMARAQAAGFGGVAADARRLQERLREPLPTAAAGPPSFRREGDFWAISYGGADVRLRDGKGLRYLAHLLAREGQEVAAVALAAAIGTAPDADDDAGDPSSPLEARSRAAFERRLEELEAEIEEAAKWHDLGRAERARRERELLVSELAAAVGLDGTDRRAGAPAERARQSVTKAIKSAIQRLGREHPVLGRHLETTVHTGLYCRYQPDPLHPPGWRVEL
jgi:hypothetical protein